MSNKFNGRNVQFRPVRVNNSFQIDRPAADAGTRSTVSRFVDFPESRRGGIGNRNITRISFTAPEVRPRDPVDFDSINAINLAQFGQKVHLSDKTVNDLLRVNVKDPQDFAWIEEKKRLEALGIDSLPFGRKQRTIQRRINFGEASLNNEERLAAIKSAVDAGRSESREERAQLGVQIAEALTNLDDVKNMTERQLLDITQSIGRLKIPKHWKAAGFEHRLWTGRQFNEQKGPITMFLLANIKPDRTPNEPLVSFNIGRDDWVGVSLLQLYKMASDPVRVLDLENAALLTPIQAKELVKAGVDNGIYDGKEIDPDAPKPGADSDEEKDEPEEFVQLVQPRSGIRGNVLLQFVDDRLRAKYENIKSDFEWEQMLDGGDLEDMADLYKNKNLMPPPNLIAALKAEREQQ